MCVGGGEYGEKECGEGKEKIITHRYAFAAGERLHRRDVDR